MLVVYRALHKDLTVIFRNPLLGIGFLIWILIYQGFITLWASQSGSYIRLGCGGKLRWPNFILTAL